MRKKYKIPYEIKMTTLPPKDRTYSKEDVDKAIRKSISLMIDDLILNGHIKLHK